MVLCPALCLLLRLTTLCRASRLTLCWLLCLALNRTSPLTLRLTAAENLFDGGADAVSAVLQLLPAGLPGRGDIPQQLHEHRRRVVGAAVKRPAVGQQEVGHGPAAVAGHQLHAGHIHLVKVGILLPIQFDADEPAVEQARHLHIVETLHLHHMAPVAGAVADGQEHRLVLGLSGGEGLLAPGIPVHRIVGVLEQVGGVLQNQAVDEDGAAIGVHKAGARVVAAGLARRRLPQGGL